MKKRSMQKYPHKIVPGSVVKPQPVNSSRMRPEDDDDDFSGDFRASSGNSKHPLLIHLAAILQN